MDMHVIGIDAKSRTPSSPKSLTLELEYYLISFLAISQSLKEGKLNSPQKTAVLQLKTNENST